MNVHEDVQVGPVVREIASENYQRLLDSLLNHDVVRIIQQDLQRSIVMR